jgi:transcriptional regulator with XRE-family HTH domain
VDFNEKLQYLRKQKNLTQEELAEALYVSRTAISKWESGRGYPSIDSLKAISGFFSVSLDELLSSDEIMTIAEEDGRQREKHIRDLTFGLLDCSMAMFLFLPFFGQRIDDAIQEASLLSLTEIQPYRKALYLCLVFGMLLCGILELAFQNTASKIWLQYKERISLGLSATGALIFMISLQPYAAMFTFILLIIKALMLIKWR